MLNIFISNDIQLKIDEVPENVLALVTKTLTLDNPMYYKLVRMAKRDSSKRKAVYTCPQTFKYYKVNGDVLHIPRGMKNRLFRVFDKMGLSYSVKENMVEKKVRENWCRNLELRGWQAEAVDKAVGKDGKTVDNHEAVIIAGTGGGKTIAMLEIAYRLGLTCTILTSRTSMVVQWKNELKKFYGIDAGVINAKEKTIKDFTVSTFQSLNKPSAHAMELVENTSVLIVDEAQEAVTDGRRKIISRFKPSYIFGTTATPKREDKQDAAINFYLGDTIYEHHETMVEPCVEIINTGVKIDVDEYPAMIDDMVENESRNTLISGVVLMEATAGKKVLVLTKRIAHAEMLYSKFAKWGGAYLVSSKDKNKDQLLAEFKSGQRDFNIIFGTTALLSVGQDIAALNTLVLACDMKAETLLIQSIGRILRLFKGKEDAKIIDFNDGDVWSHELQKKVELNPILLNQFRHRLRIYKSKGWEITF